MVRAMKGAGCSLEQIVAAVELVDEAPPEGFDVRRQARNARYYQTRKERLKTSETSEIKTPEPVLIKTACASESVLIKTPLARVDDSSTNTDIPGKKIKNLEPQRLNSTPRSILLECLSAESADAVLAHRRAKRCPLTIRAAQLLAKGFMSTGDPNAAADMMIERGWQGFKPEWFDNERAGNGNGKGHSRGSIVDAGRKLTERLIAERLERDRTGVRGDDGDPPVRLLSSFGGQRS
jgi:hypothetical protein